MAVKSLITDPATEKQANVVDVNGYHGLVVGTHPLKEYINKALFFTDDTGNINMNINRGVLTGSILMYEEDVEWDTTVVAGPTTNFDFLSTDQNHTSTGSVCIDCTSSRQGNVFELGSNFDCTDHTSFSGWAYVTGWANSDPFNIYAWENTTPGVEGNVVDLINYINTGVQNVWQKFTIPFTDMGLSTQQINGVRFEQTHRDNNLYLDDIHVNVSGANATPVSYSINAPAGKTYLVNKIRITLADDINNTLANSNTHNIDYRTWLGAGSLINGIAFQRFDDGVSEATATFKGIGEILVQPTAQLSNIISTGSNVFLNLTFNYTEPIILKGSQDDKISFTIQDDLSSLSVLKATALGREELLNGENY